MAAYRKKYSTNHVKALDEKFLISTVLTLLSGVPQGSILGPILFNIFLSDLLSTLKLSDLFNFADDNPISATPDNIDHHSYANLKT